MISCKALLPAVIFLLLPYSSFTADQDASSLSLPPSCSEEGNLRCKDSRRICRVSEEEEGEFCGACQAGFIDLRPRRRANDNNNTTIPCIDIENINEDVLDGFISEYNPVYRNRTVVPSRAVRLALLIASARFVSQSNSRFPPPSYELELNAFALDTEDDTNDRTGFLYRNFTDDQLEEMGIETTATDEPETTGLPDRVDWAEEEGVVTFVKDQGRCGCCWAISLAGAIEGASAIHATRNGYNYSQSLSFQQFVSCDKNQGGCDGGNLIFSLFYANTNRYGGMSRLNEYEYTDYWGTTTETCETENRTARVDYPLAVQSSRGRVVMDMYELITFQQRLERVKRYLAIQPVTITMRSRCLTMGTYRRGILTDDGSCACPDRIDCVLDHAVLLVGYDDTDEIPYFKIKNSWGEGWGEDGYFRVAQVPDDIREKPWGYFSILAHGVVPLEAQNVTLQVEDEAQVIPGLPWWIIVLIVLACLFIVTFWTYVILRHFGIGPFEKKDDDPNAEA